MLLFFNIVATMLFYVAMLTFFPTKVNIVTAKNPENSHVKTAKQHKSKLCNLPGVQKSSVFPFGKPPLPFGCGNVTPQKRMPSPNIGKASTGISIIHAVSSTPQPPSRVFHPKTYAACKKVIHILCLYEQCRYPNRNRKAAELGRLSHIIHQISAAGLHRIVGISIFHFAANHQPFPVNSGNIAMP